MVEVLEKVDLGLSQPTHVSNLSHPGGGPVNFPISERGRVKGLVIVGQLTSIMRSSLFGTSAILICFTATASPVPQLNAL